MAEPGTEIELRDPNGDQLVDPFGSGVVVDTPAAAAEWLEGWKRAQVDGHAFARAVKDAVIRTMDSEAVWTLHDPAGWTLKSKSPESAGDLYWDMQELQKLLTADPPLSQKRFDDLVTQTVVDKVDAREAERIAKANPTWRAIVTAAKKRTQKTRDVSVEPPTRARA